ncbi:MAG: hypothetical protein Q9169_007920 [Polycauliona sp. 2 TL-2023]
MRCFSIISVILDICLLNVSYAATIPTGSILSRGFPATNQSWIKETLGLLNNYDDNGFPLQRPALQTFRPWPAAPFNFRSTTSPLWLLRVTSYDQHRLTFRQMHAMVEICVNAQDLMRVFDPDEFLPEQPYIFRPVQREPYDLTREDVEVAFLNTADQQGTGYKAIDMYVALDVMLDRMLPKELPDMRRTVLHYADLEPRNGRLQFKKAEIRRRTDTVADAAATA